MADVLKKFGRYFLLDQVAQGGMAEIYRARLASVDGAGRLIVIKRIQAGYGGNAEFLKMFKDEIKVTMGFSHPNIVQLYDFGEEQSQPYIAMEFVDGKNLRQFISRFSELRQPFPVELAAYVVEQAACGLQYAHSFRDKISGQALNIVHRDISPQNIIISFEGTVKVIDFGIAKAATNVESTRAGVIKGKPSYLSPEQISGETLDGRSDIFSLGAVLWECLTGKKLFSGENDLAVLKLIESCQSHVKPPSTVNPRIPKELDYIVLKSLAKQREKRYQTSEEFQRALHKFLYGYMPDFNPSDLGYYAKDLFKAEIVDDRKRIQKLNDEAERLLHGTQVSKVEISLEGQTAENKKHEDTTTVVSRRPRQGHQEFSLDPGARNGTQDPGGEPNTTPPRYSSSNGPRPPGPVSGTQSASVPQAFSATASRSSGRYAPKRESGRFRRAALVALAASVAIVLFGQDLGIRIPFVTDRIERFISPSATLTLQGSDKNVTVMINGKAIADTLPATFKGVPVGVPVIVTVTGESGSFEQKLTLGRGEAKVLAVKLRERKIANSDPGSLVSALPDVAQARSIMLRLNITPGGGRPSVSVNGKPISIDNPVVQVPLDTPLELVAERTGFRPFRREFYMDSRQLSGLKETVMDVSMDPVSFGFLTIYTTPSADATIQLDGKPWVKRTPLELEKLPVGDYRIRLANEVLGMEKIVTVQIQEGKITRLEEKLEIRE